MDLLRTVVPVCLILTKIIITAAQNYSNKDMVLIRPHTDVKYFPLPTSDEPVVTWMDIQKGIYPNTTHIESALDVGEPITIFIYLKDDSNLYDIMVNDCWAYDNKNFEESKNKLHLTEEHSNRLGLRINPSSKKTKLIDKWYKKQNPRGSMLKTFLYTDLTSFKFPDHEQIYLKCDIQLCFKSCEKFLIKKT